MQYKAITHKIPYGFMFFLAIGCSSATPTAPVQKAQAPAQGASDGEGKATSPDNNASKTAGNTPTKADPTPTPSPSPQATMQPAPLSLGSSAFANMAPIPATYVAKGGGGNQSPPLQWKSPPAGTGSFAIQMVDLDFQNPPFMHWLIVNIPATSTQLPAAIPGGNNLAAPAEAMGANQLKNYAGPNPSNLHRYEWTIYAIKKGETLNLGTNSATNKTELEAKSLGKATLIGTYQ